MEAKRSLNKLSQMELNLFSFVKNLNGTMEEIEKKLEGLNIFEQYNSIFIEYSNLINKNVIALEALKRALFILWYSIAEPSCYTGINNLDKNAEKKIIARLNELIKNNELDEELKCMILYYNSISEWYFEKFKEYKELTTFLKNFDNLKLSVIQKSQMENRGQMGEYWKSISV